MSRTNNDWLTLISFIFALWFAFSGMVWSYGAALFISYPFGIVSFILWRYFLVGEQKESKLIPLVLICGLILSILVLGVLAVLD